MGGLGSNSTFSFYGSHRSAKMAQLVALHLGLYGARLRHPLNVTPHIKFWWGGVPFVPKLTELPKCSKKLPRWEFFATRGNKW